MDIKDLHITIKRSKRVKNLNLSVLPPDGRIEVSAPEDLDDSDIRAYIISKWAWVKAKQREVAEVDRQNRRTYETGESHYFFGNRYRLRIEEQTSISHSIRISGQEMIMTIHPGTAEKNRGELLWEFYRTELKVILTTMIAEKMSDFGEENVTWEIKRMRTEWGSCLPYSRHLLFNLELARMPLSSIEYIVVHELTHLQEKNHTERFVSLMDKRLPNWRREQQQLNSFVATNYLYTPDWIAEITRMGSVANEGAIASLCVTRSFLAICQMHGVAKQNYILDADDTELSNQFFSFFPLTDISLSDAIGYCHDTEFFINLGNQIAIKAIWVSALYDTEFLQEVIQHADKVLNILIDK